MVDSCPGHGPNIWDIDDDPGEVTYCDGSCVTDDPTDSDEEPGVIR